MPKLSGRTRGRPTVRNVFSRCPHCDWIARVASRKSITATYDELFYECRNFDCGHRWKAALSFVHTLAPSATPKPGLDLPVYTRPAGPPRPANDPGGPEVPRPANDDVTRASATG